MNLCPLGSYILYVDLLSDETGLSGRDLETTMLEQSLERDTIFRDLRTTH